jgi:tetratricopeptide (TPR) repeat protein/tRNA A-37 threonylcarbamoyl transferase component Bud32/TolB-like protein
LAIKCPTCHSGNPESLKFCGECGTQLPPPQGHPPAVTETVQAPVRELTTGSTFAGRYQVIEELGHGGMGRVYKVFDTKIKEKIALKLIKPEIASDKETIERFSNELRLARNISQRNVCRMFDMGESEGAHFITMEYVHGEDLKSMIEMSGSLSLGMLLSVGKQVCDGLAEAHSLGVVHRDLKPQNIMIDKHGNAKIMDFGIARSVKEKGITGPSVMIGTPEYMSPEQAEAKEVDHRSDIYSLGVILYEMATSHVPFKGDTALSIAMKHKGEIPGNPKQLNPQIPDDLSGVILKCLEKDKARRYQSASGVRSELERIEKGIPTTEKILPSTPTTSKQITVSFNPRRIVVPGVAILAVIAAIAAILSILPGKKIALRASGKPTIAVVNFENKTGDKDLDKWSTGIRDLLITDLNQSKFVNVLSDSDIYGILRKFDLVDTSTYSTGDLVKIADAGGAQYTVNGSFLKAGDKIILNATCQKPHFREVISPIQMTFPGFEEIQARVDEMTLKIKTDLNLTQAQIAGDIDKSLGEITTPNAEAWAYYIEARRYEFRREEEKAIPLLQKALALDPEFVMAYQALASAHYMVADYPESQNVLTRTLELVQQHPERVSERDRYFIELYYYSYDKPEPEWARSIEAGKKLLALYPDDPMANFEMAVIYREIEEWDEALRFYEKSLAGRSRLVDAFSGVADCYRAKDEPGRAQEILERYLREVENTAAGHRRLARHHIAQNRLDLAAREFETAEMLAPGDYGNRILRGDLFYLKGELRQAEVEYRALIEEELPAARYWGYTGLFFSALLEGRYEDIIKMFLTFSEQARRSGTAMAEWNSRIATGYALSQAGRPEAAIDEYDRAYAIYSGDPDFGYKRRTLELKGFACIAAKRIDMAEKTAGELRSLIEKGLNRKAMRKYDHLMGAIELARNNTSKALEYLERAVRSLPYGPFEKDPWPIITLAEAYFQAGDLPKARGQYEIITKMTTGRMGNDDDFARSFYHLGRIDEKLGDNAKASENYRKFLDLWKNADPGRPEGEDAKKRLAGLKDS